MKKKTYKQPQIDVIEVKGDDIICQTSQIPSAQNESYEEESESVTQSWFN